MLVPLIASTILSGGCGGCNDEFRLIKACSTNIGKYCEGTRNNFYPADEPNNSGICTEGRIQCPAQMINSDTGRFHTAESYCEGDTDCLSNWESIRTEDVCIGYNGPKPELCDNIDNNCNGEVDEVYDDDNDGFLTFNVDRPDGRPCGYDCNDRDPTIHPEAEEVCDGVDNNCNCLVRSVESRDTNGDGIECGCSSAGCDERVDEKPNGQPIGTIGICYADGMTEEESSQLSYENSVCTIGKLSCHLGEIVCIGAQGPSPELCDGVDNNCNGFADEPEHVVGVGEPCGTSTGVCETGQLVCNPLASDMICWGAVNGTNPDFCDGLDNDCDGTADEDAEPILCTNGCPVFGYQYCQGGDYTICDAPLPGNENDDPCNGLDDDCDGQIDEDQECECEPSDPPADCTIGEMQAVGMTCGIGKKLCECDTETGNCDYGDCFLACDPWVNGVNADDPNTPFQQACPEEACDGWDHNCWDGNVDGDHLVNAPCQCDPNSPVPAIAQAAQNGNCEEGLCTAGQQTCEFDNQLNQWRMLPDDCGAVGPIEEVCDELDNDCDGLTDEELSSFERVDMVFAIDITGSMATQIEDVHNAISAYAMDFAGTSHRFSLILFPAPFGPGWAELGSPATACGPLPGGVAYWNMTGGLVEVGEFLNAMQTVLATGLQCGGEPSYDVLQALMNPNDPTGVGWRENAYPYVFIIGDEEAQSWVGVTEQSLEQPSLTCDGIGGCPCLPVQNPSPDELTCEQPTNDFEVHCFVDPIYSTQYDNICRTIGSVGDNVYDIGGITPEVLRNIFADVCLPGEQP